MRQGPKRIEIVKEWEPFYVGQVLDKQDENFCIGMECQVSQLYTYSEKEVIAIPLKYIDKAIRSSIRL